MRSAAHALSSVQPRARWAALALVPRVALNACRLLGGLALPVAAARSLPAQSPPAQSLPAHGPPARVALARALTRAEAIADADAFFETYEADHPAPYAVIPRDSVRRLRSALAAALPDTLDAIGLWRGLAPIVGALGDGHTALGPPRGVFQAAHAAGLPGPLPLAFAIDPDGRPLVHHATTPEAAALVPRAARVLRVNGLALDSLYAEAVATYGGAPRYRHYAAARGLTYQVWLRGVRAPYAVDVSDSAGAPVRHVVLVSVPIAVAAATLDSAAAASPGDPPPTRVHLTVRVLPERDLAGGRVGYVDFFSFAALAPSGIAGEIQGAMERLAADSVRTLIIDLRRNGGGSTYPAQELLVHVTDRRYRFEAGWAVRVSTDTRAVFCSDRRFVRAFCDERAGALHEFPTIHEETRPMADPVFRGPVCVLVGPATFSAAAYAADAVRTYRLATLVGEETGGRANDWTEVVHHTLAHSGLPFQIATARTVRASGDRRDTRGAMPAIAVVPTEADVRAGRDPVLERATRDCPASPP